jgi:hypothetical protein
VSSKDYESNHLINNLLEKFNERVVNENTVKSQLNKNIVVSPSKKLKTSPGSLTKSKSIGEFKGSKDSQ